MENLWFMLLTRTISENTKLYIRKINRVSTELVVHLKESAAYEFDDILGTCMFFLNMQHHTNSTLLGLICSPDMAKERLRHPLVSNHLVFYIDLTL